MGLHLQMKLKVEIQHLSCYHPPESVYKTGVNQMVTRLTNVARSSEDEISQASASVSLGTSHHLQLHSGSYKSGIVIILCCCPS